jgi:hypothetical protein
MDKEMILNSSAFVLIIAGVILRIFNFPLDGLLSALSGVLIIVVISLSIKENRELGMSNFTNYFLSATLAISAISASLCGMQKIGAFLVVAFSVLVNTILTLYLIFSKAPIKISKQYIVSVFLYICLISSIVAIQEFENFKEFIGMLIAP